MDASNTSTFEPSSDLIQKVDCDTFLVYLPGFTKEQISIRITGTRILKVSGRRPIQNNRWSSFQKDFPIADNCDTNKITAKFEDAILHVKLPKEEIKLRAAAKIDPQPRQPTPKKTAQTTTDDGRSY